MDDTLRRSVLAPRQQDAGAHFAAYAGWWLPQHYAGTLAEHEAVRSHAGVFDVSHLGTIRVHGPDALAVVGTAFTNDAAKLAVGTAHYSLCCDDRGGIVDDLLVYRVAPDELLVVPNAANTAAVLAALVQAREGTIGGVDTVPLDDAEVVEETDRWAILAVQGPASLRMVDRLVLGIGDDDDMLGAADVPPNGVLGLALDDAVAYLARTGYTGEVGVELLVPVEVADDVWGRLVDGGVTPCGLGARDTLRLEMGYPLHGADLSLDVDPYTARLGWAVVLDRGPFRGHDALAGIRATGVARRLWGLRSRGRRPLRVGLEVRRGDRRVGRVTSGGFSPTLGAGIGLALLDRGIDPGAHLEVDIRGRAVDVEVVRPPFVPRDPRG